MRCLPAIFPIALMLAGCAASRPAPVAPPRIVTAPQRPVAPAKPASLPSDWNDWPYTPGDWRYYKAGDGSSSATFAATDDDVFSLVCDRRAKKIGIGVTGSSPAPTVIRTTSMTRTLPTTVRSAAGVIPPVAAQIFLIPTDPLFDAISFSRGRFVVEQAGEPSLVLPPYAEVGRVIEDCRG